MRAVTITEFGGPAVLTEVELPEPEAGPGQVLIDVSYAAVGLVDVLFRRGDLAGAPGAPGFQPPFVPGLEVSGTVRAVGPGVSDLTVGEPVVTLSRTSLGGYASVAVADAAVTVPLRDSKIDLATAVALLPNATTAFLALTEATRLRAGDAVLVHGATGGLAAVFPAVARSLGAEWLIGTVGSHARIDAGNALGYDHVMSYDDFPAGLGGRSVDVVVDPVGGPLRSASLDVLAPLGRLLAVGHASPLADPPLVGNELWLRNHAVIGFNVGGYLAAGPASVREATAAAMQLISGGQVAVPVGILPLSDAPVAHRRLEERSVHGRLVLALGE